MLSRCFLDVSVSVGAFFIGLIQISSFLSFVLLLFLCKQNIHVLNSFLSPLHKIEVRIS